MLPISEQYVFSPCEIKSMENTPILTGYISKIAEDGIQIASKTDGLPLIHCNTTVKVSIFNASLGFKILIGRVFLSTGDFIRISDVQSAADYEKRNFFRVKVDLKTKAHLVRGENKSNIPEKSFAITIRDISLSGIFFVSDKSLEAGDRLVVALDLYGNDVSLLCKILRKISVELGTEDGYGCEFLDNSGKQFDLLCKYLFDCQRDQIQIMKQIHP